MLERLTDNDINQIVSHAVERVSRDVQFQDLGSESELVPSSPDVPSSQPDTEELLSQSASTPSASIKSSSTSPFPAFPQLTTQIISSIVSLSAGDARTALSLLELVLAAPRTTLPAALLASLRRSVSTSYDRTGDSHYDMISALHKSVRGSQGSAALYWLARMLEGGEDPLYIARRMTVCASEDIGLADNHALPLVRPLVQSVRL